MHTMQHLLTRGAPAGVAAIGLTTRPP